MKAQDYEHPTVEIHCHSCDRVGRYSKARFCEIVGPNTSLPNALSVVAASCKEDRPTVDAMHGKCRPYYYNR